MSKMVQQTLAQFSNDRTHFSATVIILTFCYLSVNVGLALLMAHSFLLGIGGMILLNLLIFFFLHYCWSIPLYMLLAAPSIVLPVSASGILSRLFIGNILLALLVLIGGVRALFMQRKEELALIPRYLMIPLFTIVLVGIVSIISSRIYPDSRVMYSFPHSDVPLLLVNIMESILLLGFPIVLMVMPGLVQKKRDVQWILAALVGLGIFYSLGTIFADPLGLYSEQTILNIRRPEVFGASSSILGLLLVFFVCVTVGQAFYARKRNALLFWWALTIIFGLAVILSFGRTAWLTLCLSLLAMIGLRTQNLKVLPFILLLLMLSFLPGVSDFFNPEKVYGVDRLIMWRDAVAIWSGHPYFGIGAGNYQFFDIAYGSDVGGVAHNQFLEVLAEMGVQGLCCLLWSIVAIGYVALRRFHTATTEIGKAFALAYIGYYIGLIFFGFFGDSFLPSVAGAGGTSALIDASYNWILFGLVITLPQWEKSSVVAQVQIRPE